MRIDNKLGLTSSAEQAMHKYLFEDIYDFWGYRYAKETYGVFGATDASARVTQIMI